MEIKDLLSPADTMSDVRTGNKTRLLQDLVRRAADALDLPADAIVAEILKREELGSTGMGDGVAIPHARLPVVKKPIGILARLNHAIDFDAIDGQPVDLVFLLLLPTAPEGEQLNTLAFVARKLRDPDVLQDLRSASDDAALYSAMIEDEKKSGSEIRSD